LRGSVIDFTEKMLHNLFLCKTFINPYAQFLHLHLKHVRIFTVSVIFIDRVEKWALPTFLHIEQEVKLAE